MDLINVLACPEAWEPVMNVIKKGVIPILQIGIPILLIIFGMLDLGKAVMAGKEDEIKKNQQMLMKRAIAAVMVFFIVTLVTIVMGLVADGNTEGREDNGSTKWEDCWGLRFDRDGTGPITDDDTPPDYNDNEIQSE